MTFETRRANARFCGDTCRQRSHRSTVQAAQAQRVLVDGPITLAAERELGEVQQVDSALGQMALFAARQLDSGFAQGSAAGPVLARLESLLEKARAAGRSPSSVTDRVRDQLAERREQRAGA